MARYVLVPDHCGYCGRKGEPSTLPDARYCRYCRASWTDTPLVVSV